jgi:hypothetical protein
MPHRIFPPWATAERQVFIPSMWWHLVLNIDAWNVGVTQNFACAANWDCVLAVARAQHPELLGILSSRRAAPGPGATAA